MHGLADRFVTIGCAYPAATDYGGMSAVTSDVLASCVARSYQRARKRSYRRRRIAGADHEIEMHLPLDPFSYHVVIACRRSTEGWFAWSGFHAFEASRRYEQRIARSCDYLREQAALYLGRRTAREACADALLDCARIPIGVFAAL